MVCPLIALAAFSAAPIVPPRTDADGFPLPDRALARFGSLRYRTGWSDPIHVTPKWALSPDGKTLAIGIGCDVTLWDIESGRVALRLKPADWAVRSVAFSPDGKHLIRVDRGKVSLFNAATARERHTWDVPVSGIASFLPGTSRFVVTAPGQNYAHAFDAERPAEPPPWDAEAPFVALSPSGRYFLGESDAGLHLVDARTGRVRCRFPETAKSETFGGAVYPEDQFSALSPDDRRLHLVRPTGALLTFDTTTGRKLGELNSPRGWPELGYRARVALSSNGDIAYIAKQDYPTHRRDLKADKWLDPLPAMPGGPLVPHPDGKRLFLIASDGILRRYDLTTLKEIRPPGFTTELSAAASPGGKRVAVASAGAAGRFAMFDLTGKELWSVPVRGRRGSPRWSDDERLVACACKREVVVCDAGTGRVIQRLRTPDPARRFTGVIGFNTAEDRLVAALDDGVAVATFTLGIRGLADVVVTELADAVVTGAARATDVSPDGNTLAFVNGSPAVALFDRPAARLRVGWSLPEEHPGKMPLGFMEVPKVARFSPDSSLLLSWTLKGKVILSDPATGEALRTIDTDSGVGYTAFSQDGLWLAIATWNAISLWDVSTGQQLVRWEPEPVTFFYGVSFAGPGRLVVVTENQTALLWDLRPRKPLNKPAWDALSGNDPTDAYRAVWALADDPKGPDLLRAKIAPADRVPPGMVRTCVAALGADRYPVREAATAELVQLGRRVEPELRSAYEREANEEVRTRLETILKKLPRTRDATEVVHARAVAAMELAGTDAARKLLAEWAAGTPGARLTQDAKAALRRLGATK
jgi:WD40 repeat protein